jgi:hypothetical protein
MVKQWYVLDTQAAKQMRLPLFTFHRVLDLNAINLVITAWLKLIEERTLSL